MIDINYHQQAASAENETPWPQSTHAQNEGAQSRGWDPSLEL